MNGVPQKTFSRRPRFRRAAQPPAFRLTDGDIEIVRLIAQHRFIRSTHIAALVHRSVDRTNDRLSRLFHAGYIDRPRAQLDHYPSSGSAPMVYAIADKGVRLLAERFGSNRSLVEWGRKNREAGRPFIEHQLDVMEFYVSLQLAMRGRDDVRLISSQELVAAFPEATRQSRNPLAMHVSIQLDNRTHEVGLIPDLIFGIGFPDGSRRCFMVEIDRGTMPVSRRDLTQTSFERKMCAYLAAYASRQHEQRFGWKAFRVLTVTTDQHRLKSMMDVLRQRHTPQTPGASLFVFGLRGEISDPIAHTWRDGNGHQVRLI